MRTRTMLAALVGAGLSIAGSGAAQDPSPGPFMVFFDWGKPDVRSDDRATLDQVAAAWRIRPAARLRLTGHTDRSGSAAINRIAGLHRAQAIRMELEKRGIPRRAMRTVSAGEEQPLVQTEDGVREVQNRRVVIEFES